MPYKDPASSKAYYEANKERILAARRAKYAENSEPFKARGRAYLEANREKRRQASAKWYAENSERSAAATRAWYQANKEYAKEQARLRHARNPESILAAVARRRGAPGHVTAEELRLVKELSGGVCAYCFGPNACEFEHCTPLARGGWNCASNIVMSCKRCNRPKHSKTVLEFKGLIPKLKGAKKSAARLGDPGELFPKREAAGERE